MKKLLSLLLLSFCINVVAKVDYVAMASKGIQKAHKAKQNTQKHSLFLRLDTPYTPQQVSTGRPKATKSQLDEMRRRQEASRKHTASLIQAKHNARDIRSTSPTDAYTPPQGIVKRPKSTNSQLADMRRRKEASRKHVEFLMGLKGKSKPARNAYTPPQGATERPQTASPELLKREKGWK